MSLQFHVRDRREAENGQSLPQWWMIVLRRVLLSRLGLVVCPVGPEGVELIDDAPQRRRRRDPGEQRREQDARDPPGDRALGIEMVEQVGGRDDEFVQVAAAAQASSYATTARTAGTSSTSSSGNPIAIVRSRRASAKYRERALIGALSSGSIVSVRPRRQRRAVERVPHRGRGCGFVDDIFLLAPPDRHQQADRQRDGDRCDRQDHRQRRQSRVSNAASHAMNNATAKAATGRTAWRPSQRIDLVRTFRIGALGGLL